MAQTKTAPVPGEKGSRLIRWPFRTYSPPSRMLVPGEKGSRLIRKLLIRTGEEKESGARPVSLGAADCEIGSLS